MDLRVKNFNFEEFRRYTQIYERARVRDEEKSTEFYKMVKYVQAKLKEDPESLRTNAVVKDFAKVYRADLIEIPDEFKDLKVEDDFKPA